MQHFVGATLRGPGYARMSRAGACDTLRAGHAKFSRAEAHTISRTGDVQAHSYTGLATF